MSMYGMYISAEGAAAQSRRIEVLSNNIANVDTPGFKRDFLVMQSRHSEAIDQDLAVEGDESINDIGGGVLAEETFTQFSQGVLKQTDIKSDLAINGDGFFVVEKDGEEFLTRAGDFHFDESGALKTNDGFQLLSAENGPVRIDPLSGEVNTRNIRLVRPQHLSDLVKQGENRFRSLAETKDVPTAERNIRSGYVESAGVKPAIEMMELIEASRAFESNVRMIQNQDSVFGTLVNRVMRQS